MTLIDPYSKHKLWNNMIGNMCINKKPRRIRVTIFAVEKQ